MVKSEVSTPTDAQYVIDALKSGSITFQDFTDEFVDFVETGGALIAPEVLEGIPFAIMGITYREGFSRAIKGQALKADYASLEVVIADETTLNACGVDWKNRGIKPLDVRILNDGGTGIRRQMTRYLHIRSYATVTAKRDDEIQETGKLGESDFDIPMGHWSEIHKGEKRTVDDGTSVYEVEFERMVIANRGTRSSTYENPAKKGEIIKTWYLA
jgi:hypothetical protein